MSNTSSTNTPNKNTPNWLPWLVIIILIGVTITLWQPISILYNTKDTAQLQAEINRLGPLVPIAYLALSIIQIVGAPIPGYPVQLLGGVLFGTILGGIYAVIGMVMGGLLSAWLARTLGRPFIEKQINPETLAKYEGLAKLETLWVWFILLTIPLGDFPYYIAGLSRVKFRTLALAILLSRGPFTFVITWAGATSVQAPAWVFWTLLAVILAIIIIGYLTRDTITRWMDTHVLHRLQ